MCNFGLARFILPGLFNFPPPFFEESQLLGNSVSNPCKGGMTSGKLRRMTPMRKRFPNYAIPILVSVFLHFNLMTPPVSQALDTKGIITPALEVQGKLKQRLRKFRRMREGEKEDWHYGAYVDFGYLPNLSSPGADLWRSKTTDFRLNSPQINLARAYIRKEVNPLGSRWGGEFGVQTGVDTEGLVSKTSGDTIGSADSLRHFSRANLSYLFPAGNGLKITAGLMNSYIGYASFHSKDNANYTRGYLLDNVPYFLFGVEGIYPLSDTITLGLYTLTGYTYLTAPNAVPSFGFQAVWETTPEFTLVQNLYYGPDQRETDLRFWRFFSDSIIEYKDGKWVLAGAFDIGTEEQSFNTSNPRYIWMAGALWIDRNLPGPWWLGFRPEFYWDPDGAITGFEQLIWAVTSTLAYRVNIFSKHSLTAKLEYRFDRSTGSGGGFFTGQDIAPGSPLLTPNQQLFIFGLAWAFDS